MSLGLVAYGSSDESEESDDEETNDTAITPSVNHIDTAKNASRSVSDSTSTVMNVNTGPADRGADLIESSNALLGEDSEPGGTDLIEDDEYDFVPNTQIKESNQETRSTQPQDLGINSAVPSSFPGIHALKLPPPKNKNGTYSGSEMTNGLVPPEVIKDVKSDKHTILSGPELKDDAVLQGTTTPLLKGLPAPAPQGVKEAGPIIANDELEDEVKPKVYDSAELLKPPGKRKKQPVKITIPDLPDSDSDEEGEPKRKQKPGAKGKVGLFSLLPAPKNVVIKTTNRPLIPHTLKKSAPAAKKPVKPVVKSAPTVEAKKATESLLPGVPDVESDDEDNDGDMGNFFSLGESSKSVNPSAAVAAGADAAPRELLPDIPYSALASSRVSPMAPRGPWLTETKPSKLFEKSAPPAEEAVSAGTSASVADAPLTFKQSYMAPFQYNQPAPSTAAAYQTQDVSYNYTPQGVSNEMMETAPSADYLQDEEFLKIQGKVHRGREAIDIINVNVDDKIDPTQIVRNVTEEQERASYSRRRKDLPSAQQRRKHQITYLAFQAKERELELKNEWAQNRQTKRQTQSKYGF